jgi:capsular exopolysaccharide synthesis family protein
VNEAPRYVTVRDYLRVLRERPWLILAIAALFTAAAYVYSSRQDERYEAEAAIEFQSQSTQASQFGQQLDSGGQTPEQRAAAAAATLVRPAVLEEAKDVLGFKGPAGALGGSVTARPEARTNLVIISGHARTGEAAAQITNAFAKAAVTVTRDEARKEFARLADAQRDVLRALKNEKDAGFARVLAQQAIARLDELSQVARPAILRREATAPRDAASPHVVRTTLLGLLVGLTIGLVAAFFRDALDGRARSVRDLTAGLRARVLGNVPEEVLGRGLTPGKRRWTGRRTRTLSAIDLEPFRIVRTNLEFLGEEGPIKTILITSAMPAEGKSTVATALATACATAGKRTLLVEGDLRRPTLASRLGVERSPGLTDYLTGDATPDQVLQTVALPPATEGVRAADSPPPGPIVAIVAGSPSRQPSELLRSDRCRAFFSEVSAAYDIVIVDGCPLLPVVDSVDLATLSDAVVLCLRGSKTKRAQVESAMEMLEHLPDRPLGVIVTGQRVGDQDAPYGYYAYAAASGSS